MCEPEVSFERHWLGNGKTARNYFAFQYSRIRVYVYGSFVGDGFMIFFLPFFRCFFSRFFFFFLPIWRHAAPLSLTRHNLTLSCFALSRVTPCQKDFQKACRREQAFKSVPCPTLPARLCIAICHGFHACILYHILLF